MRTEIICLICSLYIGQSYIEQSFRSKRFPHEERDNTSNQQQDNLLEKEVSRRWPACCSSPLRLVVSFSSVKS